MHDAHIVIDMEEHWWGDSKFDKLMVCNINNHWQLLVTVVLINGNLHQLQFSTSGLFPEGVSHIHCYLQPGNKFTVDIFINNFGLASKLLKSEAYDQILLLPFSMDCRLYPSLFIVSNSIKSLQASRSQVTFKEAVTKVSQHLRLNVPNNFWRLI